MGNSNGVVGFRPGGGVKPQTKEQGSKCKDLMETESYQDYLKQVKDKKKNS